MDTTEDDVINFMMSTSDASARHRLLKRLINVLPSSDFNKCMSIISKCKKYRKKVAVEGTPNSAGRTVEGCRSEQLCLSVPQPLATSGWLMNYTRDNVVSLDVEKVIKRVEGNNVMKAAIISVVDFEGNEVFKTKIYRESYIVTRISRAKNGITATDLKNQDCEDEFSAYQRLREVLEGKLIVGIALENDFSSMDMAAGDFDTFDLQWHYYKLLHSENGKRIEERLSLRSMVMGLFGKDMQPVGKIHEAKVDAVWTMEVFKNGYLKVEPPPKTKDCNNDGVEIPHYK